MRLGRSIGIKHDAILRVHNIYRQAREEGESHGWILSKLTIVLTDLRRLKAPAWVIASVNDVAQALLYETQQRDLEACYAPPGGLVYSTHKESKLYEALSPAALEAVQWYNTPCCHYWSHIPRRFS